MSPKRHEAERRAREFIDKIIKINQHHGMGDNVPEDTYLHAVRGSAEAFKGLTADHNEPRNPA